MASTLKRKRGTQAEPRKVRKVVQVTEAVSESDQEDEEWKGLADDEPVAAEEGRSGTKPKLPPTGEELRAIKDATDLFRSSSFKLQIDALLPNVRPKASRLPPLDRFLLALHTFLMGLPSVSAQHPLEAARILLKKNVSVPYALPLPSEETNWKVAFEKPSDITLAGSWANKISVKSKDGVKFGVDLVVEMPDSLFQEKDYLNARFFQKRAFYLATIAAAIKSPKSNLGVDVSYESLLNDPRLTKLVLVPKKDDPHSDFTKLHAKICIIPIISSRSPIPLHRLSPSHSNLRISTDDSKMVNPPTPLYNTALLTALSPKSHLLATHTLKQDSPAFADALALLRVWANQRGYGDGSRVCVRGFEGKGPWWSALLGLLIAGEERLSDTAKKSKRKPLGRGLSSYQLFRAALDFLAKHDFEKEPVYLRSKDGHRFPPEEYQQNHEAIFVDSSSTVNLLAGVPIGSLELLRYDALKTLETLDHSSLSGDPFTDVFLRDHRDLPTRYDTILRVDLSSVKPRKPSLHLTLDTGSPANALLASISSLLRQGLGDRVRAAAILHTPASPRPLSQAHPSNPDIIYIGLIHNPHNAFRLVDHGPAADEAEPSVGERFRDFWGDKAELRRFKDGRIIESVVWDVKTVDERTHVPGMVVRHVLDRHFAISADSVQTWQASFDSILRLPESISRMYMGSGIATGFRGAISAYDNLVKGIKALDEELPLALLNVSPISEYMRHTSVFSPVPLPTSLAALMPSNARYLPPIEFILEFEKSSKWPDDLRAIQKIKLAFFERIATSLMSSIDGLKASVVVGDGVNKSEILDQAYLEIVTKEGWAFHARIWHDREATLLDRIIDNRSGVLPHVTVKESQGHKGKEHQEAVEAKEVYTRRFIHAPRHHRAIAGLCHQYPAYAGTVRLTKRWLASHWLLQGHISDEVVEIICAGLFIGDGKDLTKPGEEENEDTRASVPGSKERGFAAVLEFLKEWKWEEGLFVPLYGKESYVATDVQKVPATHSKTGVWKITTELDIGGHIWTANGPDVMVAHRVHALAIATWDYLQEIEQGRFNVKSMFAHPTEDYDFIISLDSSTLPRYFHNIAIEPAAFSARGGKYANVLQHDASTSLVRPGFDSARLLFGDLQRVYADTFKLFHDPLGGDCIGAVWDPSLRQPRTFRVLGGFSSIPVKKEDEKAKAKGLVVLNDNAVFSEIERMGEGLVKGITVHV